MYFVVDDSGEAASWYRSGPQAGKAAGHPTREAAERERKKIEYEVGEASVTTEEPPVPSWAF